MTSIYAGEQDAEGLWKVNINVIRWSIIGGMIISLPLSIAAVPIMSLFTDEPEILSLSVIALRLYLIGVPFLSLNFSAASFLQGIGRNLESGIVILLNHTLISIGTAVILAMFYGTTGVFASFGICEIIMCMMLILNMMIIYLVRREKFFVRRSKYSPELRMSIGNISEAVHCHPDYYP